jgi:MFS family permease
MMERVGAKRWISRIMVTWGLLSAGMAFVTTAEQFYVMRFLLGAAEAGFFLVFFSISATGSHPHSVDVPFRC